MFTGIFWCGRVIKASRNSQEKIEICGLGWARYTGAQVAATALLRQAAPTNEYVRPPHGERTADNAEPYAADSVPRHAST